MVGWICQVDVADNAATAKPGAEECDMGYAMDFGGVEIGFSNPTFRFASGQAPEQSGMRTVRLLSKDGD